LTPLNLPSNSQLSPQSLWQTTKMPTHFQMPSVGAVPTSFIS
jgi:hypothetical protein